MSTSPDKARPHNGLAMAHIQKGMLNSAISELRKAIAINQHYYKTHNNLDLAHIQKGILD